MYTQAKYITPFYTQEGSLEHNYYDRLRVMNALCIVHYLPYPFIQILSYKLSMLLPNQVLVC